jgi:hypothetical protein
VLGFDEKPEEKRRLGRPRRRWEDGIRLDLRESGGGVKRFSWLRIGIDEGALVNEVMNLRVLKLRSYIGS